MKINHRPNLISSSIKVIEEGHKCSYVCTTQLEVDGPIVDVFYYATPKGEQRYLGVYKENDVFKLCDADIIEEIRITAVQDVNGVFQYSRGTGDTFSTPCGVRVSGGLSRTELIGGEQSDFIIISGKAHKI